MDNQLEKSIVKSAWIIFAAIVMGTFFMYGARVKYTRLNDTFYIEQSSGKILIPMEQYQKQNK